MAWSPIESEQNESIIMNWNTRYAVEKTAVDFVTPALHVLQFGHGIVDVAKDILHPFTHYFNGDPHKLHELQQNAQNFKAMEPGGGPGRWWADEHLQNYQDANQGSGFNGVGTAIDSAAALGGAAAFGIKKLKDKLFQRDVDPILDGRQQHLIHDHGFNNLQEALADYNFIGGRADNKHHLNELHGMDHALGDMGEFYHEHP